MNFIIFTRCDDPTYMKNEIKNLIDRDRLHCLNWFPDDYILCMGRAVYDALLRPKTFCGVVVKMISCKSYELTVELARNATLKTKRNIDRRNWSYISSTYPRINNDTIDAILYSTNYLCINEKEEIAMNKINYPRDFALNRIKKVIFNDPVTVVLWNNGTKTIVRAENEPFDPEKGLAMAISKYFFNNEGYYYDIFKKWLPKENIEKGE